MEFIEHPNDIIELTPPQDLCRRFDYLPQDYVDYRKVKDRLMLATSTVRGNEQLRAAREGDSEKSWPRAHFLGPLHPVTDWAADRALASMARGEIPAVLGTVDTPTGLLWARDQLRGGAHRSTVEDVRTGQLPGCRRRMKCSPTSTFGCARSDSTTGDQPGSLRS